MKIKQAAFALIFCVFASAGNVLAQVVPQRMQLRPSGFVGPDSVSHYVIVNVPGVKQYDLYKRASAFINTLYLNPQAVIAKVDGESIVINAINNNIKGKSEGVTYEVAYNIAIDFKDGRFKFTPKILSLIEHRQFIDRTEKYYVSNKESSDPRELNAIWIVRDKGPLLFMPELKQNLDAWINSYVAGMVNKTADNW